MRIKVGDCALFFDVEGAKLRPDGPRMREVPTLLLLHGGPGFDHSSFKPAMSPLAEVAQIIYLDHRGQGRSDRSASERWTLATWADDVRKFCDALEIERPIVMGHSFGGFVAAAYAARHPEHPGKLILSSTAGRLRLDRAYDMFERLGGKEARTIAERFWQDPSEQTAADYIRVCFPLYNRSAALSDADSMRRTVFNRELMYRFIVGEGRTFDLLPELGRIQCPTLLLAGEDDPICPIRDAEDIAQRIPANLLRFERFANAGHGVFRDLPEAALRVMREFIES
ncbi:MAG TPA: alpha/beta hydrolase [Candidatus Binataceae bacterium]|nr:alpha/beta hydrolase [Candidatus Binataceae bacterium]